MAKQGSASKTDALIKLGVVFFISLLSFSIGAFVGKQFSDSQHRLAQLEPSVSIQQERQVASIPRGQSSEPRPAKAAMSEQDIQRLAAEFEKEAQNKSHRRLQEEAQEPAQRVARGESPQAHAKLESAPTERETRSQKDRLPSSLPATLAQSAVGKYTVQVASYIEENDAQAMAEELREKGYSAFYIPTEVRGQTWYRVSVGLFNSQSEAVSYRGRLAREPELGSAFVQRITQ